MVSFRWQQTVGNSKLCAFQMNSIQQLCFPIIAVTWMQSWRSMSNEQRTSWACPWRRPTLLSLHGSTLTMLRCCRHVVPFYEQHWTTGSNTKANIAIYLYIYSHLFSPSHQSIPALKTKLRAFTSGTNGKQNALLTGWQGQIRQKANTYESLVTSRLFFYFAFVQPLIMRNTVRQTTNYSDIRGSMASTCFNSLSCTLEALATVKNSKEKITGKPHNCWILL